jgi:hypothetical protein
MLTKLMPHFGTVMCHNSAIPAFISTRLSTTSRPIIIISLWQLLHRNYYTGNIIIPGFLASGHEFLCWVSFYLVRACVRMYVRAYVHTLVTSKMEATIVASSYSGSFCELNCLVCNCHQLPAASWLLPDPGTVCVALLFLTWNSTVHKRSVILECSSLL